MRLRFLFIIFTIIFCTLLGGCKPIFQQKTDKYLQVELSKNQLKPNIYYIKDGTKFIATYKANTASVKNANGQNQNIVFLTIDYKTVPTLYKNEIIAIASQKTDISDIKLTRYKEIGYTIGSYGLTPDAEGYLSGSLKSNIYINSGMYQYLSSKAKSDQLRIISINNQPVSKEMLTNTGIFNCLEKKASYSFDYYAGTYYSTGTAVADTFMLEEYEYYNLTESYNTKNGYIAFSMPEDAKSGWYYINGSGLFKYVAEEKGINVDSLDMNEPYYSSMELQESIYSQKFSTSFDVRMTNVTLTFDYDAAFKVNSDEPIKGTVYAPDGTAYEMIVDKEKHIISCALDEAMAGKWTVYIQPKALPILDMSIISNEKSQEITEEEFPIVVSDDKVNYRITVSYEGEGTIYAILVDSEGKMNDFMQDSKNKLLIYDASFLKAGSYSLKVYHYTDTNILDVNSEEHTKTNSDIITITE